MPTSRGTSTFEKNYFNYKILYFYSSWILERIPASNYF